MLLCFLLGTMLVIEKQGNWSFNFETHSDKYHPNTMHDKVYNFKPFAFE